MAEQVQSLIDRIKTDAVKAAEAQAQAILDDANAKARALLAAAEADATATRAAAEQAASAFAASGAQSLEQAARDLFLRVGQQLEGVIGAVIAEATTAALTPTLVAELLLRVADGIAQRAGGRITVVVSPADRELLTGAAMASLRERLEKGIDVRIDPRAGHGFKLTLAGDAVQHDFGTEAIATALAQLVRPRVAELVLRAALPQRDIQPQRGNPNAHP